MIETIGDIIDELEELKEISGNYMSDHVTVPNELFDRILSLLRELPQ